VSFSAIHAGVRVGAQPDFASHSIIVWDESMAPFALPTRLLAGCGLHVRELQARPAIDALRSSPSCPVIVIGLDGAAAGDAIPFIKNLSDNGFAVIVCIAHAASLSVAERCALLLAGCSRVVHGDSPRAGEDLTRHVLDTVRVISQRADDEQRLRRMMSQVGFVGQSAAMMAVFDRVIRLSRLSDLPTLITGETGTGKELVARALHAQDPKRQSGPFVALNCAALSSGLVESELFGHRRGAFTSAERDRRGLFRAAEGGVLFLDEVAELDAAAQTKLLRVLQDSRVRAVGDEEEVPVNVRVVAATNRDLRGMVERHEFRADLFHRLTVLSVHIPPLRERREDVPVLTQHFARKHASVNALASRQLHPDVIEALTALDLPGNARQLENIVRWALVQNDGAAAVGLVDLPPDVWLQVAGGVAIAGSAAAATVTSTAPTAAANADYATRLLAANGWNLSKSLDSCERSILEVALREAAGNQSHAARRLGITARSVYNMVRRHHLT